MAKIFQGIVVSTAMKDTAVVEISRRTPHPLYKKLLTRSRKFKVDTKGKTVSVGEVVTIKETRPIAKGKHFAIAEKGEK